jgi:hypothetical protein
VIKAIVIAVTSQGLATCVIDGGVFQRNRRISATVHVWRRSYGGRSKIPADINRTWPFTAAFCLELGDPGTVSDQ